MDQFTTIKDGSKTDKKFAYAEDAVDKAQEKAGEAWDVVKEKGNQLWNETDSTRRQVWREVKLFVQKNPAKVVGLAVLLGAVAGLALTPKRGLRHGT